MKYRAEIDGLRAVAVLPVIFFHAHWTLFSGGYVGVDVFFVISGYLITTILMEDLQKGRFNLIAFYERRARRILPALFFMSFVSTPVAWLFMFPEQWTEFSNSLIATVFFASNVFFWLESGYFAQAVELKPLVHTWTLAVEEQFYLIMPVALFLMWRFTRRATFWIIAAVLIVSFLMSEFVWSAYPRANFYLIPTRAWELLTGSSVAIFILKYGVKNSDLFAASGMIAILTSLFLFDHQTPFPGFYTWLPVLGTALLIIFCGPETRLSKILSVKYLVFIGLMSYSAYLWHQPLFAFARLISFNNPSPFFMAILAFATFVIAYLSWKFIEAPFRDKEQLSSVTVIILLSMAGFVLAIIGFLGRYGLIQSYPSAPESFTDLERFNECMPDPEILMGDRANDVMARCLGKENNFILIGDSHAKYLSGELGKSLRAKNANLLTFYVPGCLPVTGTERRPKINACVSHRAKFWELARSTNATIILSARWRIYIEGTRYDNDEGGREYGNDVEMLVIGNPDDISLTAHIIKDIEFAADHNRIFIVSQIPEAGWDVPSQYAKRTRFKGILAPDLTTSFDIYNARNKRVIELFDTLEAHDNIDVVNVQALACDKGPGGRCSNTVAGRSLYTDDDHPSPLFAARISDAIVRKTIEAGALDET